jgi:nitrite reductase/ring-hydroxylating ferredoxin subunit
LLQVLKSDELANGAMAAVSVNGVPIALYRVEGQVFATGNVCTHQQAFLTDGYLEGEHIECPLHQGVFCVRTGKAMGGPVYEDLRTYATSEQDGLIYISMD